MHGCSNFFTSSTTLINYQIFPKNGILLMLLIIFFYIKFFFSIVFVSSTVFSLLS